MSSNSLHCEWDAKTYRRNHVHLPLISLCWCIETYFLFREKDFFNQAWGVARNSASEESRERYTQSMTNIRRIPSDRCVDFSSILHSFLLDFISLMHRRRMSVQIIESKLNEWKLRMTWLKWWNLSIGWRKTEMLSKWVDPFQISSISCCQWLWALICQIRIFLFERCICH